MKKIIFFCDNCKEPIASQRLALGFQEEKWLIPMGYQEWCKDCVADHNRSLLDPSSVNVNDTEYEHGGGGT